MHGDIFYCIEQAKSLEHGNMEIHISNHFLLQGEWGRARQWLEKAFKKGLIKDLELATKIQHEIASKFG